MVGIFVLITLFWIPSQMVIIRNIFWDLYIWQIKEYRFDRMFSHLLSQEEDSKNSNFTYSIKVISLILILLYLIFPDADFLLIGIITTFTIYIYEAIRSTEEAIGRRLIHPKISTRNIIIISLAFFTILLPFAIILYPTFIVQNNLVEISKNIKGIRDVASIGYLPYSGGDITIYPIATLSLLFSTLFILMIDLTTPLIVSFYVFLTQPFAYLRRKIIINKAKNKLKIMTHLKVIGITGSFGKTTTKEILFQIIKSKYKTVKTPQNYNSAVGIALSSNLLINNETEVFIAEMGAYTKNEIKESTDIIRPDVAIVTGIDSQHITLFGSTENITNTKFEIVKYSKDTATIVLNGDNDHTFGMANKTEKQKIMYFILPDSNIDESKFKNPKEQIVIKEQTFPRETVLFAYDIQRSASGVTFTIRFQDKSFDLKTNIRGVHNVSNILASIGASMSIGIKLKAIVSVINTTKFQLPYLNRLNGLNSTIIIDDGYNANSTGFLAALDELNSIKTTHKKIVITKGIIELGWKKTTIYKRIAKEIIKTTNMLITSDKQLYSIIKNIDTNFPVEIVHSPESFTKEFYKSTHNGDYILIEGSMSPKFLKNIIDKD